MMKDKLSPCNHCRHSLPHIWNLNENNENIFRYISNIWNLNENNKNIFRHISNIWNLNEINKNIFRHIDFLVNPIFGI